MEIVARINPERDVGRRSLWRPPRGTWPFFASFVLLVSLVSFPVKKSPVPPVKLLSLPIPILRGPLAAAIDSFEIPQKPKLPATPADPAVKLKNDVTPPPPPQPAPALAAKERAAPRAPAAKPPPPAPDNGDARRVRVGDERGRPLVARVYGAPDSRVVMLPNGQLGWPNALIYTDEPFRPAGFDEVREDLLAGPYEGFKVHQTKHYLIFYEGSTQFAIDSGKLLESLQCGLSKSLGEKGIDVHDPEFPLVAVIFKTESDFRAHKRIDPDIQAYYEILSNRIFFYELASGNREPEEVAAMRRPQTVAHEGTHQILNNIGVQPRMAQWPLWLVEGLAEYCAPTGTKNGEWAGFNKINPFHMATMHDLDDSLALQGRSARLTKQKIGRQHDRSMVEYVVTRERLTPTDYALAWALTHYLANKRFDQFVAYLKTMSKMPPLVEQSVEHNLQVFRAAFGIDLVGMDHQVRRYLDNLNFEPMPYYAVVFEQPLGQGMVKRGTLVSQSPQVIRQWVDEMQAEHHRAYVWHVQGFQSKKRAFQAIDDWIPGR